LTVLKVVADRLIVGALGVVAEAFAKVRDEAMARDPAHGAGWRNPSRVPTGQGRA
tara:strand:- start:562 stop:726 length:165 start_codon:yes stop_codon:yes gene_type:complete